MTLVKLDVDGQYHAVKAVGPVSIATNTNTDSATIDLGAYPGWKVLLVVASGTWTDGTYAIKLRESADDSSYADSAAGAFSGSAANITAADTARVFTFAPVKRYLRVRITSTGTTTGALLTAVVLLVPPTS